MVICRKEMTGFELTVPDPKDAADAIIKTLRRAPNVDYGPVLITTEYLH